MRVLHTAIKRQREKSLWETRKISLDFVADDLVKSRKHGKEFAAYIK
jgi:hypothetical protein